MIRNLLALALMASAAPAFADKIDGPFVGCETKEKLTEFIRAGQAKDYRQMEALLRDGCISIDGLEYSIVKNGLLNVQIRVYAGSQSAVVYTVTNAVR